MSDCLKRISGAIVIGPKIFWPHARSRQKNFRLNSDRVKSFFASTRYEPKKYLGPPPKNDRSRLKASCLTCPGRAKKKICLNSDRPKNIFGATQIGPEIFCLVRDRAKNILDAYRIGPENNLASMSLHQNDIQSIHYQRLMHRVQPFSVPVFFRPDPGYDHFPAPAVHIKPVLRGS